jgi:hypothetical protein
MSNLCAPTPDVLCFGCCPPIRPPHYDLLDYIATLRREFAYNRQRFRIQGPNQGPIVGFSCWALGFLDATGRRIGCLLHPEQHQGRDLRNVTGYGDKCRRERCLAARVFAALTPPTQSFWLEPAAGLGSFHFSSARANPLFHLLLWGTPVLEHLSSEARQLGWTATETLWRQPMLLDRRRPPRAHRYLLRLLLTSERPPAIRVDGSFQAPCQGLWELARSLPASQPDQDVAPQAHYLHQLPLDEDYLDFLRLALNWQRTTWQRATALKAAIEAMVVEGC